MADLDLTNFQGFLDYEGLDYFKEKNDALTDEKIAVETERAKTAENTLTTNLNAEISRAKSAEQTNATAISNEVTRAKEAESNLDSKKIDKTTVATSSTLGLVKSGTDITVDASGNVSVNDDSHNHVISNVDGLQSTLDAKVPTTRTVNGKALSANITLTSSDVGADASGSANTALTNAKAYTDTKIDALVGEGASTTLDTIGEISQAIEEHQDVTDALNAAIGTKANASDLTSHTDNTTVHITSTERTNWDDANSKKHTHSNKTVLDNTTASYTTAEQTKLSGIATGAEVNQNAFSNVVVDSTTIAADSKTDSLTLVGSNVTLTPDATNDKVTIGITKANVVAALGYTPPTTDTNTHYTSKNVVGSSTATSNTTSALTNGNVYLNSVENGAVTSTHKISGSGATTVITDASGNIVISSTDTNTTYSKLSQFTNDSGYITGITKSMVTTALGYTPPTTNTTYSLATASTAGLIKVSSVNSSAVTVNSESTTSGRYYPVELNSDGKAIVNVPWTDTNTNTTYSVVTASANGLVPMFDAADGTIDSSSTDWVLTNNNGSIGWYKLPANAFNNTTYSAATTSAAGLMSASDKSKLDAITASADSVAFTQSLTSGTQVGTITINGTATKLYAPTNTDTHYTTGLVVGASATATANAAATNGNVYMNVLDNSTVRNAHNIVGSGSVTVTSDANGKITITGTDTDTVYIHPASGVTAGTYGTVTVDANGHVTAGTVASTVAYGGTGRSTLTSGYALVGNGTSAVALRAITATPASGSTSLFTAGGAYTQLATKLDTSAITTSLASTSTTNALAASAGKDLQDQITQLNSDLEWLYFDENDFTMSSNFSKGNSGFIYNSKAKMTIVNLNVVANTSTSFTAYTSYTIATISSTYAPVAKKVFPISMCIDYDSLASGATLFTGVGCINTDGTITVKFTQNAGSGYNRYIIAPSIEYRYA